MSKLITISGYVSAAITIRVPDDFDVSDPDYDGFLIADQITERLCDYMVDNFTMVTPSTLVVEEADPSAEAEMDFTNGDPYADPTPTEEESK